MRAGFSKREPNGTLALVLGHHRDNGGLETLRRVGGIDPDPNPRRIRRRHRRAKLGSTSADIDQARRGCEEGSISVLPTKPDPSGKRLVSVHDSALADSPGQPGANAFDQTETRIDELRMRRRLKVEPDRLVTHQVIPDSFLVISHDLLPGGPLTGSNLSSQTFTMGNNSILEPDSKRCAESPGTFRQVTVYQQGSARGNCKRGGP